MKNDLDLAFSVKKKKKYLPADWFLGYVTRSLPSLEQFLVCKKILLDHVMMCLDEVSSLLQGLQANVCSVNLVGSCVGWILFACEPAEVSQAMLLNPR